MEPREPTEPEPEFWANDIEGFYTKVFETEILDSCRKRKEENIFIVPEIKEYVERVRKAGGQFIGREFIMLRDQSVAVCEDCYGSLIVLVQLYEHLH